MSTQEPSIRLHPTKGVNPRMTTCRQCGKDVGVALIGVMEFKDTCPQCGMVHYGGARDRGQLEKKCKRCGCAENRYEIAFKRERIEEHEKIPIELCDDCQKLNEQTKQWVAEGGIHFKCSKCGCAGAVRAGHPLSVQVREKTKINAPDPVGVEFDDCSWHTVQTEEKETQ